MIYDVQKFNITFVVFLYKYKPSRLDSLPQLKSTVYQFSLLF